MNPTTKTTNDAPRREPDSMLKVCSSVAAPPTNRNSAIASEAIFRATVAQSGRTDARAAVAAGPPAPDRSRGSPLETVGRCSRGVEASSGTLVFSGDPAMSLVRGERAPTYPLVRGMGNLDVEGQSGQEACALSPLGRWPRTRLGARVRRARERHRRG